MAYRQTLSNGFRAITSDYEGEKILLDETSLESMDSAIWRQRVFELLWVDQNIPISADYRG